MNLLQTRWLGKSWLIAACALVAGCAGSATLPVSTSTSTSGLVPDPASIVIAGSRQWDMPASGSGRSYRIFVAVPDKPAPAGGYPVLYVLDANAMFMTAVEAVRAYERRPDVPKDLATVVVGIGYPDGADVGVERTLDLTPVPVDDPRVRAPAGGADAFLSFIEQDLKPKIAGLAPVDLRRQGIFGHSFGGLFVLHTLARKPDAFQVRVAASPSIWFANEVIKSELAGFAASRQATEPALRMLLTAGEYEQAPSPAMRAQPNARKMIEILRSRAQVDNARQVAASLSAAGLDARFDEISGEDHGSVIPAAISRAVVFMLAQPLPVPLVPTAQEYLGMTPEERYDLRLRVRDLPDPQRIPWLTRLKQTLHDGLSKKQAEALHEERNRMDKEQGTKPHG